MANKNENKNKKQEYTYEEYLNTFTPERKAEKYNEELTRESFMDILKRVSVPIPSPSDKEKSKTS